MELQQGNNQTPETKVCEECKEKPSKYKCPGCSLRSCSLPCVKAHKHRTGCSGKRNITQFVPLSRFNDNLLLSDYNLLEEMKRVTESSQRMREKLRAYPQFKLPVHLQCLRRAAKARGLKLLLLPSGMSKREKNQTRYVRSKKCISWTIEWRFQATDIVLRDHCVHEDTNLFSVIEKHLKPGPWNHQLRQFSEENLESLKFFIRKDPKGPTSPFCELNIKAPLRQQLTNVVVLEYPVIHVFLPLHNCNFEVVKAVNPVEHRPETKISVDSESPSPKGVAFKEEEIEDDNGSTHPQVYDFTRNALLSPLHDNSHCDMSEKTSNGSNGPLLVRLGTGDNLDYNSKTTEPDIFDCMDFDFDQGLIDAYSDLVGQVNPDDFFDIEGEFPKAEKVEKMVDFPNSEGTKLMQEELEEGEIVE